EAKRSVDYRHRGRRPGYRRTAGAQPWVPECRGTQRRRGLGGHKASSASWVPPKESLWITGLARVPNGLLARQLTRAKSHNTSHSTRALAATRSCAHRFIVGDSRLVNADVRSAATLAPR